MLKSMMTPAIIIASFLVVGFITQKFVIKYIIKLIERTKNYWDTIFFKSLRKFVVFWFLLAGIRVALPFIRIGDKWLPRINETIAVLLIASLTVLVVRVITGIYSSAVRHNSSKRGTVSILVVIIKIIIYTLGLLVILQSLGVKITPLITALGIGGLAVALALQDTLANLFAGLQIIFAGQVRGGDFIRLDSGEGGIVTDITWRNSTIKNRDENIVVIPNAKLAQAIVTNYYLAKREVMVRIPVGVSYSSDLEKVEEVTVDVARETLENFPDAVEGFTPRVLFTEFNDSSIDMMVVLKVKEFLSRRQLIHEFIKRLHKRYNKEGIVIPFPIRTLEYMDIDKISPESKQNN